MNPRVAGNALIPGLRNLLLQGRGLSDLDGRSACEKLFGAVKNAISRGGKSLTLAVHEGYFHDEIFTDCEDESGEVSNGGEIAYPTRNDIIRNYSFWWMH